jgi:hypothetical protein
MYNSAHATYTLALSHYLFFCIPRFMSLPSHGVELYERYAAPLTPFVELFIRLDRESLPR